MTIKIPQIKGLKLSREQLPQIAGANINDFISKAKADGITVNRHLVNPLSLKPTQNEFNKEKVKTLLHTDDSKLKPSLSSNDGYILDGHHRWVADYNKGAKHETVTFDLPLKDLMARAHSYSKSFTRSINEKLIIIAESLRPKMINYRTLSNASLGQYASHGDQQAIAERNRRKAYWDSVYTVEPGEKHWDSNHRKFVIRKKDQSHSFFRSDDEAAIHHYAQQWRDQDSDKEAAREAKDWNKHWGLKGTLGHHGKIYRNLTPRTVLDLLRRSGEGEFRGLMDREGNIEWWNGYERTHHEMGMADYDDNGEISDRSVYLWLSDDGETAEINLPAPANGRPLSAEKGIKALMRDKGITYDDKPLGEYDFEGQLKRYKEDKEEEEDLEEARNKEAYGWLNHNGSWIKNRGRNIHAMTYNKWNNRGKVKTDADQDAAMEDAMKKGWVRVYADNEHGTAARGILQYRHGKWTQKHERGWERVKRALGASVDSVEHIHEKASTDRKHAYGWLNDKGSFIRNRDHTGDIHGRVYKHYTPHAPDPDDDYDKTIDHALNRGWVRVDVEHNNRNGRDWVDGVVHYQKAKLGPRHKKGLTRVLKAVGWKKGKTNYDVEHFAEATKHRAEAWGWLNDKGSWIRNRRGTHSVTYQRHSGSTKKGYEPLIKDALKKGWVRMNIYHEKEPFKTNNWGQTEREKGVHRATGVLQYKKGKWTDKHERGYAKVKKAMGFRHDTQDEIERIEESDTHGWIDHEGKWRGTTQGKLHFDVYMDHLKKHDPKTHESIRKLGGNDWRSLNALAIRHAKKQGWLHTYIDKEGYGMIAGKKASFARHRSAVDSLKSKYKQADVTHIHEAAE
jgi:hypothetical protein